MKTGIVLNIQKYSVHDGPGIRTTVFFKGCPLACKWCHNPESICFEPQLIFYKERCIGCGRCQKEAAPGDVVIQNKKAGFPRGIDKLPLSCAEVCPTEALERAGEEKTVAEVFEEIKKDVVFYDKSGGGVTFSGGEPLSQLEFLQALLKKCKQEGISTAVDTSGFSDFSRIESIMDDVDLFLFDLKHMSDEVHRQITGVSNQVILENLKKLSAQGKKIFVRMPIIPTMNDGVENIEEAASFLAPLKPFQVNILPYHDIAKHKYKQLGRIYLLENIQPPSEEKMKEIQQRLQQKGLKVIIGG